MPRVTPSVESINRADDTAEMPFDLEHEDLAHLGRLSTVSAL
jgi:hypothetical protein